MIPMLAGGFAIVSVAAPALPQEAPAAYPRWNGEVSGEPIALDSPFDPIPTVSQGARRVSLPAPKGPISRAIMLPPGQGAGQITLLAPWHGGMLVGTDGGEWGGRLYSVTRAGVNPLISTNVLGGFTWGRRFYVLSGLRHLSEDSGMLWEFDLNSGRVVRRIPLPAQPMALIATPNRTLILQTSHGDVALSIDGQLLAPGQF